MLIVISLSTASFGSSSYIKVTFTRLSLLSEVTQPNKRHPMILRTGFDRQRTYGRCEPQPIEGATEHDVDGAGDHENDGGWREEAGAHDDRLVGHVQVGDVVVDEDRAVVV